METKTIDKEKTVSNIIETCNLAGVKMDIDEFNKRLKEPGEVQFLIEAAELVGAKVKYLD